MTRTMVSAAAVALALAGGGRAGEQVPLPKGPPPAHALAERVGDRLRLSQVELVAEYREERRRKAEVVDGKPVQVEYTVRVLGYRPVTRVSEVPGARVFGTDGKPIDPKRLPDLLKKKTAVLVSADGNPIDPFYLR